MANPFYIYAIYDHPKDYPDMFVCRRWQLIDGVNTPDWEPEMLCQDVDRIREMLTHMGLVKLMPPEGEDPVILETWL